MDKADRKSDNCLSLAIARGLGFCVLVFERIWPKILPLVLIVTSFCALSWFGFFNTLSYWPHVFLLWLCGFAAIIAIYPLRHFQIPSKVDVDKRIEAASGLAHQPLEVQEDKLATGADSAFAQALWAEHQRRMANRIKHLQVGLPHPDIPHRDPYALRSLIILITALGFAFSFGSKGGRLSDAFDFSPAVNINNMRIDAWITPPAYTNQPPIFLTKAIAHNDDMIIIPEGSILNMRIYDGRGVVAKRKIEGKGQEIIKATDSGQNTRTSVYETTLTQNSSILLQARHFSQSWTFIVTPDTAPTISLTTDEPGRVLNGSLDLKYKIDDDYGAIKAWVDIKPLAADHDENGHPLYDAPTIPLTLPRGGKGEAQTQQDISSHPWAGSEVVLTLMAEDGAGHIAHSQSYTMVLPQRSFGNPIARAIVEQRRILVLNEEKLPYVMDMVQATMVRPESTLDNFTQMIVLQSLWRRLREIYDFQQRSQYLQLNEDQYRKRLQVAQERLRHSADYMWQIALNFEGDQLDKAMQRLKQAQAALRDALRNGAGPEEIERLTQELRQAMMEYMDELAQRNTEDQLDSDTMQNMQAMNPNDLEGKLKQLEDLAKTGNRAAAEQLLNELENMMNNLMVQKGGDNQQAGNKTDQMQQQMNKLGDMMRRQQEMLNDTHKLQDEFKRGEKSQDDFNQQMDELQKRQNELQSQMNDLMKDLQNQGIKPDNDLKDAERQMQQSGEALSKGEGGQAAEKQAGAIDSMRKGAQGLMKQMKEAMKKNGEGQGEDNKNTDPLGRQSGSAGQSRDDNKVEIPSETDLQKARRILDEIRKKLGQSLTPEMEKEYLERLLQFDR